MRDAFTLGCLAAGLLLAACDDGSLVDGRFTPAEWEKINRFSPLPLPPRSPTNRFADEPAAAAFGQRLFFEKRYAGRIFEGSPGEGGLGAIDEEQKVSCADCHDPKMWFTDTRSNPNRTSLGTGRTKRNAPSIVNVIFYEWGNWAGSNDQLWKQGANLPEAREVFNSDRLRYAHVIYQYYRDDYNALFCSGPAADPRVCPLSPALDPAAPDAMRFPPSGKPKAAGAPDGPWEDMTDDDRLMVDTIMANCGKAIEAYERLLVSGDAPFDRYVAGDHDALTPSAKRGLELFIGKAGCDSCHKDQTFTDQQFHNTGVTQGTTADLGRFDDLPRVDNPFNGAGKFSDDQLAGQSKIDAYPSAPTDDMKGQFRTKSLRHIAETGPYFHNGSAETLFDVVAFYNGGGAPAGSFPGEKDELLEPLNLTEAEIADLVEFLRSLTGRAVPEDLTMDTAATAPVTPLRSVPLPDVKSQSYARP